MSPALALMPALAPEPPRAPEQLVFPVAPLLELMFRCPVRARRLCSVRRCPSGEAPARVASADADLLAWRPRPGRARPARAHAVPGELRVSRPAPRARVVKPKPLTPAERKELARTERYLRGPAFRGLPVVRPATRAGCADVPRPCPFVSCQFNLYLDVTPSGAVKLNFSHLAVDEMDPALSCARDVQDQGGVALEVVGQAMNISMERARQLVDMALAKGRAVVRPEDCEIETDEGTPTREAR
ncbi:MAG TPA: hypothetical protein VNZ05_05645 [Solirubrobacteraceae bacterium]|nr:hypothetical protein [Solirubrobacteraceae bacterium]